MSTTDGRNGADAAGADVGAALRAASFVHVVAHADGDALAGAALLARALDARGTPFQLSVARTAGGATRRAAAGDDEATTVAVGFDDAPADALGVTGPLVSPAAYDAASAVTDGGPSAATLALAGVAAGGGVPERDAPAAAERSPAERRPGVAVPTADLVDGLAHTTLFHAGFSGDEDATGAELATLSLPADLDGEARRNLASAVALAATGAGTGTDALERALRPLAPAGPFATVAGYGDVLEVVARTAPGTAAALATGHDVRTAALDAWRETATAVHAAVRSADPARYSGLVVVDAGRAPTWLVARLVRDVRSPEPAALAVGDDAVALSAEADARSRLAAATAADVVAGTETLAYAEPGDPSAVADAVRGAT